MELLVRLVLTTNDLHNSLSQRISEAKATRRSSGGQPEDVFSDSDDDSVMSEDASVDRNTTNKNVDETRARQRGHLVKFCIDSLSSSFSSNLNQDEKSQFLYILYAIDRCKISRSLHSSLALNDEFTFTLEP